MEHQTTFVGPPRSSSTAVRSLLERTTALLSQAGLRVLIPQRLPPNDGGIAYGQAAIAALSD